MGYRLLLFRGEGKGYMAGVEEYVVISDGLDKVSDFEAPGFKLTANIALLSNPDLDRFPLNRSLANTF